MNDTPLPSARYSLARLRPRIAAAAHEAQQRAEASRAELYATARVVFLDAVRQSLDRDPLLMPLAVNVSMPLPPPHRGFDVDVQKAEVGRAAKVAWDEISDLGFRVITAAKEAETVAHAGGYVPRTWAKIAENGQTGPFLDPSEFLHASKHAAGPRTCWQFLLSVPTE